MSETRHMNFDGEDGSVLVGRVFTATLSEDGTTATLLCVGSDPDDVSLMNDMVVRRALKFVDQEGNKGIIHLSPVQLVDLIDGKEAIIATKQRAGGAVRAVDMTLQAIPKDGSM